MNEEKFNYILNKAKEMKNIQGSEGNYNYDDYMLGLYNGMEMIISLFEQREPVFIDGHDIDFIDDKSKQLEAYENMRKEAIEYVKGKKAIINTDVIRIFDLFEIDEQGYTEDLLNIINKVGSDK